MSGDGRGSAIVITVGNEAEASKLCANGLRFGGVPKMVEKYWEAGPSSVCMTCSGIGYDRFGGYGKKLVQCVICAGAHKSENTNVESPDVYQQRERFVYTLF